MIREIKAIIYYDTQRDLYDFKLSAPLSVCWQITTKCNLNCKFCISDSGCKGIYGFDTLTAKKVIKHLGEIGVNRLDFTGGEPLLRKDLGELIIDIHKRKPSYGYHRIWKIIVEETGWVISANLVHKVCKILNIKSKAKHYKYKKPGEESIRYENIIGYNWNTSRPFEKVVSDTTSFWFKKKKYDWTFYIDVFNNEIIGSDVSISKNGSFDECLNIIADKAKKANKRNSGDENEGPNQEYKRTDFIEEYIDKLNNDLRLIDELCSKWDVLSDDPKMETFIRKLDSIMEASKYKDKDKNTNQKLVIFTECIATQEALVKKFQNCASEYKILSITAKDRDDKREEISANFDANYKGTKKDDYQILITTDVLAEGVWQNFFNKKPAVFTREERKAWIAKNTDVALGSDAFFPFGDNIERAHRSGVKVIAQPGGSVRDDNVIECANKYNMVMAFNGIRLFHH